MDHRYNQRTRNPVWILVGQDSNGRNLYITTNDIIPVIENTNFYYQSQSLQNQRNRLFILIGLDTIRSNNNLIN